MDFALVWSDHETCWKDARKHLFGCFKIKAGESEAATAARFILCSGNERKCSKAGSMFIRGSTTLAHEDAVMLDRGLHLLTEPRGFACYASDAKAMSLMLSSSHDLNQFERFAMLFGLGLAYRSIFLSIIEKMGTALRKLEIQDGDAVQMYASLAALREAIVMFDARHYFQVPVSPEKQELFMVVQQFMHALHVHPLHEEMAYQLGEVSRLADHKLETIQQQHREAMLSHQQQAAARHDQKMGRLNIMLAVVALLLTAVDMLSHPPSEWWNALSGWLSLL